MGGLQNLVTAMCACEVTNPVYVEGIKVLESYCTKLTEIKGTVTEFRQVDEASVMISFLFEDERWVKFNLDKHIGISVMCCPEDLEYIINNCRRMNEDLLE